MQSQITPAIGPKIKELGQSKGKKVYLRDDERKALLVKQCCFRFRLYLAGKGIFCGEVQRIPEQKTGINVNAKSFLQSRVPGRRGEVAKDIQKDGVVRYSGDFELAMEQWISLVDGAMEKAALLVMRQESETNDTIFSDSTAAIERACADQPRPGQALAKAIIELEGLLIERWCTVTIRWTSAPKAVEGNEIVDSYAKWEAEGHTDPVAKEYVREASLAHLTRKTKQARTQITRDWIRRHAKCRAWAVQIKELWRSVGTTYKWKHPRAPTVRLLF